MFKIFDLIHARSILDTLREAFWSYRLQILILTFLSLINGALEGIGLSVVIPFLSFFVKDEYGSKDAVSKIIEQLFSYVNLPLSLRTLFFFVAFLFVFKGIILFLITYFTNFIATNYEEQARGKLFKSVLESDWSHLSKQKLGYLDQVLITDVNNSSYLLALVGTIILVIAKIFVYIFIAFEISRIITVFAAVAGLSTFILFRPLFSKNRLANERQEGVYKELSHHVNESFVGMKSIKSAAVESSVIQRALLFFSNMKKNRMDLILVSSVTDVAISLFSVVFILAVFAMFYKTSTFNLAYFSIIIYAISRIFAQIQSLQSYLHGVVTAVPYLRNLLKYEKQALASRESDSGLKSFLFSSGLEFNHVSFTHTDSVKDTLSDISFTVNKGQTVGLIGPSGSGKTTIADIALRLQRPTTGMMLLDGVNVNDVSMQSWRSNIGYVSQDVFLLNDTIENNIRFYSDTVTHNDVIEAAKLANIYDHIIGLPNGFETIIGERGIKLSGGQKQRVVLARALIRKSF
ncbi:MAG: ABC transporter ATP-binding protein [Candidatus Vogelbacteria bacterium]|nr:ABC transporter ATP-binding protein [Candidatus Vogelbacteria bacterium]